MTEIKNLSSIIASDGGETAKMIVGILELDT